MKTHTALLIALSSYLIVCCQEKIVVSSTKSNEHTLVTDPVVPSPFILPDEIPVIGLPDSLRGDTGSAILRLLVDSNNGIKEVDLVKLKIFEGDQVYVDFFNEKSLREPSRVGDSGIYPKNILGYYNLLSDFCIYP